MKNALIYYKSRLNIKRILTSIDIKMLNWINYINYKYIFNLIKYQTYHTIWSRYMFLNKLLYYSFYHSIYAFITNIFILGHHKMFSLINNMYINWWIFFFLLSIIKQKILLPVLLLYIDILKMYEKEL